MSRLRTHLVAKTRLVEAIRLQAVALEALRAFLSSSSGPLGSVTFLRSLNACLEVRVDHVDKEATSRQRGKT
jgi:hypothetical protein